MNLGNYILGPDGKTPVLCKNTLQWGRWMETANRKVKLDKIDGVTISTVFLGFDHNFFGKGAPILFETMIFHGELDEWCERCSTWAEAELMHERACELVRKELDWVVSELEIT